MKYLQFYWLFLLFVISFSCDASENFIKIEEGFDIISNARSGISDEGDVLVTTRDKLIIGDGTVTGMIEIDLSSVVGEFVDYRQSQSMHIRNGREVVFLSDKTGVERCIDGMTRGVYRVLAPSTAIETVLEDCISPHSTNTPQRNIDMSPNGTLIIPTLRNSFGALKVGSSIGPIRDLISCPDCAFSNVGNLAINNAEQVVVQMEFSTISRELFFFDDPENNNDYLTLAQFGIGAQPSVDINDNRDIIFSINEPFNAIIEGVATNFRPGIYLAEPTARNTDKRITLIADDSGDFCYFGDVTINNLGHYAFNAQLGSVVSSRCSVTSSMDGVFKGPDPIEDSLISRGDEKLESHQFFDSVKIGYINNNDELSFITTYSEPLVSTIYVWKADLSDSYPLSLFERFTAWVLSIVSLIINFLK